MKKTYRKRRAAPRKRVAKRRTYRSRSKTNVPEMASCSVTRTATVGAINTIYNNMNTQIADYPRATVIAAAYQEYRITNIKMRFKSPWDTYSGAVGGYQKPYFYYMLDKVGSVPNNITLEGLKGMGAKPRAFDEGSQIISWAPSVLSSVGTNIGAGTTNLNKPIRSPWLTTSQNPDSPSWTINNVDHLGVYWGVFAALAGPNPPVAFTYDVEIEVQFQFRKPLVNRTGSQSAVPITLAMINDSVDGVVDGPDGV